MKFSEHQIMEFARIFDDIITSDSATVQSAFQRVSLLSSLAKTESEHPGPFEQLVRQLDWMENQMNMLRREVQVLQNHTTSKEYQIDPGQIINLGMQVGQSLNTYNIAAIQPLTAVTVADITLPATQP